MTFIQILPVLLLFAFHLTAQDNGNIPYVPGDRHTIKTWGTNGADRGMYLLPLNGSFLTIGLATAGHSGQIMLTRLDKNLDVIWQKTLPCEGFDFGFAGTKAHDGNVILSGFTNHQSAGGLDVLILKIDLDGNVLWRKTIGGEKHDRGCKIIPTSDGNYVIAGQTESWGAGGIDGFVLKINEHGEVLWQKTFGSERLDRLYSAVELDGGDLIISGITNDNYPGNSDLLVVRISPQGDLHWRKTYGGPKGDIAHSLHRLPDNTFFTVGYTAELSDSLSDALILHLDGNGEVLGKYIHPTAEDLKLTNGYLTDDGQFISAGFVRKDTKSQWDVVMAKFDFRSKAFFIEKIQVSDVDEEAYHAQPFNNREALILGHTMNNSGDHLLVKWAYPDS